MRITYWGMASLAVASLGLFVLQGCASQKGGEMAGGQSFRIVVPMLGTTVKQGETQDVTVKLDRGKYFKQDVALEITASPGITVEPAQATVLAGDKPEVHLLITAPPNAALGEYRVHITGTPQTGEPTRMDLPVKVKAP